MHFVGAAHLRIGVNIDSKPYSPKKYFRSKNLFITSFHKQNPPNEPFGVNSFYYSISQTKITRKSFDIQTFMLLQFTNKSNKGNMALSRVIWSGIVIFIFLAKVDEKSVR